MEKITQITLKCPCCDCIIFQKVRLNAEIIDLSLDTDKLTTTFIKKKEK